jgi:hypothetical protein
MAMVAGVAMVATDTTKKRKKKMELTPVEIWEKEFLVHQTWRNLRISVRGFVEYGRCVLTTEREMSRTERKVCRMDSPPNDSSKRIAKDITEYGFLRFLRSTELDETCRRLSWRRNIIMPEPSSKLFDDMLTVAGCMIKSL